MPDEDQGPVRSHPNLFEINTLEWLAELSRKHRRTVTLGSIPDTEWDALESLRMDLVWLMGVWQRSPVGRRIALQLPGLRVEYERAHPGWTEEKVLGSPYSVQAYQPDARAGDWDDLRRARRQLHRRGMGLVLDFVPNHTAIDHAWATAAPDRFVGASLQERQTSPESFVAIGSEGPERRYLAHGRDPNFPAWTDTLQLDHFNPATRTALLGLMEKVAAECDGLRFDMAMLLLNDVFGTTWKTQTAFPDPQQEFWQVARERLPESIFIGEAYWGTQSRLQQLGFNFTYDKTVYDALVEGQPGPLRELLSARPDLQARSLRFLENHDEPRSAERFSAQRLRCSAWLLATIPGMKLYQRGQFEGRRIRLPVQLSEARFEDVDLDLHSFYMSVLEVTDHTCFHEGAFRAVQVHPFIDDTADRLVASLWTLGTQMRLVVINLTDGPAQGRVHPIPLPERAYTLHDLVDGKRYLRSRPDLETGLHVILAPFQTHVLAFDADRPAGWN